MKERIKGIVIGLIIGVVITVSTVLASTGAVQKTLEYNDVKITLNGNTVTPKDANGNVVEPFIIDGTTYLPVRAVSNALGLYVEWDGNTKTVMLSDSPFPEDATTSGKTEVEQMVEVYGDTFAEGFKEGFEGSGLTCDVKVSAKGNNMVLDINIHQLENLTSELRKEAESVFSAEKKALEEAMGEIKTVIPSMDKLILNIRENNGTLIVSIEI